MKQFIIIGGETTHHRCLNDLCTAHAQLSVCLEEIVKFRWPRLPAESAESKEKYSPRCNIPQHLVNRLGYGPRGSRLVAIDKDRHMASVLLCEVPFEFIHGRSQW